MRIKNFTLESLCLKGNYSITVSYSESTSNEILEFNDNIASRIQSEREIDTNILPSGPDTKLKIIEKSEKPKTKIDCASGAIDVKNLKFIIVPKPKSLMISRKIILNF